MRALERGTGSAEGRTATMAENRFWRDFSVPMRSLGFAVAVVAVAVLVLGASRLWIGPNTAQAGFLTMLLLLGVARVPSWTSRLVAAAWSLAVAGLGFVVGSLGLWATLAAVVAVSLVQGLLKIGEVAILTRSPVNLLAFATLSQGTAEAWHVILGALIGAGLVLGAAAFAPIRNREQPRAASLRDRLDYGIATAIGAALIVLFAELTGFDYAGWMMLSFCVILAVSFDAQFARAADRVAGSLAGVAATVAFGMLPAPIPVIAAVLCLVASVAYIQAGKYRQFVLFLTPGILLSTSSELPLWMLGVYRIEAVLIAAAFAVLCSAGLQLQRRRRAGTRTQPESAAP
ncbi:FUSC family protein [Leucobacter aridicollis]|uniref:Integral membrane bound transporter domain-containing protein n=1 Tax=Leucobacter aridicollis TaxID=283878 RepID=A0A852QXC4_9MICO|nr:FUSC family protein [Leucobacter aridicollis]MBL3682582.1 FUSC family protein [Leucobacter aridicollis]NYD26001.1 hypothetical protein [Leucobacter aridicollis]